MNKRRLTISVLLLAMVLLSIVLSGGEKRRGAPALPREPSLPWERVCFSDEAIDLLVGMMKKQEEQRTAGQITLAHASNAAVDLRVTADGTFQVSLVGSSIDGLMAAAGSPLLPDATFGIPRGVYIRIRDKQGNLVTLPSCDLENWYTPLLHGSKLAIEGEDSLVPAKGSSGRVGLSRMLLMFSGGSMELPPLDHLEFKLLVRLDPFLLNADGSPADGAVPPLETGWLSGGIIGPR